MRFGGEKASANESHQFRKLANDEPAMFGDGKHAET
jgi:hypothetical protein